MSSIAPNIDLKEAMFTGIVEAIGTVSGRTATGIEVESALLEGVPLGASVAINGTCLTVVDEAAGRARFDIISETFERTNLGELGIGDSVNLELAMPANGRFDGHIVQGHIDGTGEVVEVRRDHGGTAIAISVEPSLAGHIVEKGSITINGVSLTVTAVDDTSFQVALIPHTLEVTTLGQLEVGSRVNLETDILAKYMARLIAQ